ncbi:MAG: hypothetical protein KH338_00625 [Oscillospiraceae bacterium]|nr:hypothetical protein [Oscillospiraceae bacterium]
MYLLFWLFFIYAFLGWCTEVSYAALKTGRFVNRGFLNGPVCPVYGCGAVIVLWALEPLRGNLLLLFLGSVALTSLLEWLTGFVLERLFHQRWWDYSQEPFNLNGYICLRFSIAWGLACLFVVKLLHPSVLWCVRAIPHPVGVGLLILFSVTMAVDLAATVRTIARMNRQLSQLDELATSIKEMSNELGANLADRVLDAVEIGDGLRADLQEELDDLREVLAAHRAEVQDGLEEVRDSLAQRRFQLQMDQAEWLEQRERDLRELRARLDEARQSRIFGQRRLLRAFPGMRSTAHQPALELLRRRLEHRGN